MESGRCDQYGFCISTSGEEDAMEEMYRYYRHLLQTFGEWCKEKHLGLSRQLWLIIGASILIVVANVMCYFCNHVNRSKHDYSIHHHGPRTSMHRNVHKHWHS